MTGRRPLYLALFLLALPLLVAWLELSLSSAVLLVLLALLWRWGISLSALVRPAPVPALELETIAISHFSEKVRWCMDRAGLDYRERQTGGTLGAFFTGRTVPQLKVVTGAVRSTIGNSPDILRFVWGRYAAEADGRLAFLQPTPERLALERDIDRYGVDLQVWAYHHALPERRLTLHVWGIHSAQLPRWQRAALWLCYPVLKRLMVHAFGISTARYTTARARIDDFLADLEQRLLAHPLSLLGGEIDYVDLSAAAMSGPWLNPEGYGGGKSDSVRLEAADLPPAMQADIARWRAACPHFAAFVQRLYTEQRGRARG